MDVGLAMTARNHPDTPRPLTEIYQEVLDEAVLGEQLGFRSWWLAEHHFAEDQHNPSPVPAAGRGGRPDQHHPDRQLRPAPPAAQPDPGGRGRGQRGHHVDGRLELAIGAGPMPNECAVFGIDPKESFGRTYEALEVIEKCFTDEGFTHQGRYFTFRNVRMTTKPVQQPGPRIYMAALGPQSLTRAGERGYSLASMVHTPLVPAVPRGPGRGRADPGRLPAAVRPAGRAHRADPGPGLGRGRARAALVGRRSTGGADADAAGPGR